MMADGTFENITKKERLQLSREKAKLEKVLGGIANMSRLPSAIYLVDIGHEHIGLAEAKRLNVPTFAMVDTNCDPTKVDYAIPANDDATKSIEMITNYLTDAIIEGLEERKKDKEDADNAEEGAEDDGTERSLMSIEDTEDKEAGERRKRAAGGARRPSTGGGNRGGGPARPGGAGGSRPGGGNRGGFKPGGAK